MTTDMIFNRIIAQFDVIEKIYFYFIIRNSVFATFLTEIINNKIVSYAGDPSFKLPIFGITTLFNSHNNLHKGFLKNIFSQLFIANNKINVRMDTALISV